MSGVGKAAGWGVTLLAAVLVLAAAAWVAVPRVLHVHGFVVLTGSMEPALPVGSMAFVRETEPDDVEVGDVLTFYSPASANRVLVTHRVIEVVSTSRGPAFRTQGDANDLPDEWVVPGSAVYGTLAHVVPHMGHVTARLQSRVGFLLLMGVPGVIIVFGELRNIWRELSAFRHRSRAT